MRPVRESRRGSPEQGYPPLVFHPPPRQKLQFAECNKHGLHALHSVCQHCELCAIFFVRAGTETHARETIITFPRANFFTFPGFRVEKKRRDKKKEKKKSRSGLKTVAFEINMFSFSESMGYSSRSTRRRTFRGISIPSGLVVRAMFRPREEKFQDSTFGARA